MVRKIRSYGIKKNRLPPMLRKKAFVKRKPMKRKIPILGGRTMGLSVINANDPFPPKCFKRMTYCGTGQLVIQNGILGTSNFANVGGDVVWRLNSPYDPYIGVAASLNTSAYGMTEMASLYNRYKVFGCLIEIQFYDPSALGDTRADGLVLGLILNNPSNTDTVTGLSIAAVERRPQGWTSTLADSGKQSLNFRQYLPMHTAFNVTKLQYAVDLENTTAATNSDPGSVPTLHLSMADSNARSDSSVLYMNYTIKLTYFTQFYQRKQYA